MHGKKKKGKLKERRINEIMRGKRGSGRAYGREKSLATRLRTRILQRRKRSRVEGKSSDFKTRVKRYKVYDRRQSL